MTVSAVFKSSYLAAGMLWMAIWILACPAAEGMSFSLLEGLDLRPIEKGNSCR